MNDPNGTFFWQGRYHLFYQYNPHEAHHVGRTGTIHWGHTVSENLVDWVDLPIALTPTPDGPDMDGCFSGTGFVGPDGVPTIIYHGVPGGICLATSTDDMLVHWEKHPANPVILTPGPDDPYKVDGAPCGWVEGDTCYAITGNSSHDAFDGREPDRAYLFKSDDMAHWEYMHPFYEGGVYTERGEDCAVPDFFPLGDKHVLLFASHRRGPHYYVGSYADNKFIPEHHRRLAFGETNFTARTGILNECQTLLDDNNRRILFARISEARYGCVQRASGWAGIMALPSVLSLATDNHLLVEPVPSWNPCAENTSTLRTWRSRRTRLCRSTRWPGTGWRSGQCSSGTMPRNSAWSYAVRPAARNRRKFVSTPIRTIITAGRYHRCGSSSSMLPAPAPGRI
jgi:beta-fructofuranosidase